MGEEKEILLRGKVCAYLTGRLMGDPIPRRKIYTPQNYFAIRSVCQLHSQFNLTSFSAESLSSLDPIVST